MSAFKDIREYVAIPRLASLRLSPDGSRLIAVVQSLNPDTKSYGTALWEIPADGDRPHRLTRSAKGEASAAFTDAGDVLFTSRRPDPTVKDSSDEAPALWQLPGHGGEARQVADRPGGIGAFRTAGETVVFSSDVLGDEESTEEERRKARKDAGISAILHEGYPVRYWDHDLGPARTRLFAGKLGEDRLDDVRELTPDAGDALHESSFDLSPDGSTVVTTWREFLPRGENRVHLVAIDVASGERRVLVREEGFDYFAPAISPDGTKVAAIRDRETSTEISARMELWIGDLATGEGRTYASDLFPHDVEWAPDSSAVYIAADLQGRRPIFRVPVGSDDVSRVTDEGAFLHLSASADGSALYALRSGYDMPATPVRVDPATGEVTELGSPAPRLELPGTLTEISATADDGQEIRGWLVLPEGASADNPAPFLLWIHGGPIGSWNDWSWRWNPWIMASQGYAVLLPDPCMSTGYGQHHIDRGWADWGPRTLADLDSIVDVALARDDIDDERIAAMGGSFGGYMANWVAGHTDRYKAIVTHASLWNLDQFAGTTDASMYWQREFGTPGSELYEKLSPHHALDKIVTPMLVIHGDKDYRVPIGEGLRLWWDLQRTGVESKFLYFPDENHWILKPGNVVAWYETVGAFLAHHVLGQEWKRPESVA
ncbi:S9 family peptidase [Nonomuraea sp. NPDC050663]|uniref:S9 family peptidase n=1 Tax=Nonomuraea sp. NPDC050663 TaxID=3364370 RepID=UPI0037A66057